MPAYNCRPTRCTSLYRVILRMGNLSRSESILIDGIQMQITSNLIDALYHLRKHVASGILSGKIEQLIWVDAICINQHDHEKRNRQVALMRDIYARATNVVSWLGCGDSSVLAAFDFMKEIVQAANHTGQNNKRETQKLRDGSHLRDESAANPTKSTLIDTVVDPKLMFLFSLSESVIDFFSLPYWHRIWIVQEVVLANPSANIIICGDDMIKFRDVQMFRDIWLAFLKELQLNHKWESVLSATPYWSSISVSWNGYLQRMEESLVVWSYYDFMRGLATSGEGLFFVILATAYQASDARDAVFALCGMISNAPLVPDYSKPIEVVYTDWFVSVLEDWQDLQPLYFSGLTQSSHSDSNLPSWVPDLSSPRPDNPVWDATLAGTIEKASQKSASFGLRELELPQSFPHTSHRARILHTKGIWLDHIAEVKALGLENPVQIMTQFCISCQSKKAKQRYRTGIPILQAIFRVLMCGINRFSSAENETKNSMVPRDTQVTAASKQFQLHKTAPLLQAVAKFMLLKGDIDSEALDDVIVQALCRPSPFLGTDLSSDVQLAAAFVAILLQDVEALDLRTFLTMHTSSDFRGAFLSCFFPDKLAELECIISNEFFQDEQIQSLSTSISKYLQIYEHAFFFTSTGYLGNGPASMIAGDRIVVFDGARMPFIVRPTTDDSQFSLIGPCYVEGLSNGEPATMARRGDVSVEDIMLV